MTAAVVVAVMVLMVNLTPGAAAGAVTGEAVGRTRTSGRLFAPPGTLAASLLLPDPVKVRLRPGLPSRPIPPLRRFRRSQALLQAAQTIEDMVKVMEDKGNMQPFNSSLKTELLLLSQEIHSSMASLSNGAENTTLVNFTQETPEPIFNNPVDTSQHIISNPEDTSQHIISDPVDTLQHINSNPEDTSQHIISNPEDTSQHISSIINNLNNTSSVVFSNPKDTSQHIISNPEDTSQHIIRNPKDTSQHIISNPKDTSQHIIRNPKDTSQHIIRNPKDTSQHIISNPEDTSQHIISNPEDTSQHIINNPEDTSQHIISNPEDTSQHIIRNPEDTSQHIISNPEDTSQHIINNPKDTSQHIIRNPEDTSQHIIRNPEDTSQHIINNPKDTSQHIISNPEDTSQHIISNPEDTSQHIISNPEDTSQHIFSDPEDTSQHIISDPGDTSGHIINIHNHPENTSSTTLNNPQNTLGPILSILNPEHTMEPILSILNPPKNTSRAIVTNPEAQEPEGDTTADDEDIGAAQEFLRRVKEILEGSGIELVLPIDCGRNPLQPDDQLGTSELPWLVALGSREDGRFFYRCPGLIVTNFHVLTDADCTASPNINVVHVSRSGLVPDEGAEENFVVGRRIHPDITTLTDLFSGVNVGLVELAEPFVFHDALQPVCLPGLLDKPDPFAAFSGLAAGYSVIPNSQVGRVAEVYAVNATVYGPAWCRSGVLTRDAPPNATLSLMQVLNERHVCAALDFDEIGKSVLLAEDARTGRVRVVGVGSFANAEHTFPVTYTLVQPHRFWVEVTLKRFLDNTATRKTLEETIDERL